MPDMNTLSVAAATTPTVLSVGLSHYLTKSKHRGKPTYHLGYHQGLELVRKFLVYASHRTVEELQAFTSQYVPVPTWVHVEEAAISDELLEEAATKIAEQLGADGVEQVGGKRWWKWRVKEVKGEWIEMRQHYNERAKNKDWAPRTILYVHGGAYFFGSVDEHRYQLQRHARKMKARVFAPRYRLAPQFPFPCGLQDILASYLYLLSRQPASTIIFMGDSAGGGAIASLLCICRDQGIPLPAGSILISPWVDLTHSFPSVIADNSGDYIPAHGFLHRSSPAWPPPTEEDIEKAAAGANAPQTDGATEGSSSLTASIKGQLKSSISKSNDRKEEAQGFDVIPPSTPTLRKRSSAAVPSKGVISLLIDGHEVRIKDQIQLYTTNELLSHPLVSPVLQGSLGGLPPMMVLVGGSEVLRDEQIYFAHKAANPRKYPPPSHVSTTQQLAALNRWKNGTDVYLQVFDDCCHVTPTLSFTKPAKYMYRSIARFGDWLFAREALQAAAVVGNTIPDTADPPNAIDPNDLSSVVEPLPSQEGLQITRTETLSRPDSSSSLSSSELDEENINDRNHISRKLTNAQPAETHNVPTFTNHMVRQRVDHKGNIHTLPPASELECMQLPMEEIGCIKPEPVRRWMEGKKIWDEKYAKAKKRVQEQRAKEIAEGGYLEFEDDGSGVVERPPGSALVGRRRKEGEIVPGRSFKPSYGLKLWSMIGAKQDVRMMETEQKKEEKKESPGVAATVQAPPSAPVAAGHLSDMVKGEGNLSSSSSSSSHLGAEGAKLEKTQSQIDRLERIASVPGAVLVGTPLATVDVTGVKFQIEKKTLLGRLGKIDTWGSVEVNHQTPSFQTYLRAGHIPHLTWEVAENQLKLEQTHIFQMTLPTLVSNAKIIEKFGKGAAKFCGMPAGAAVHLTPFDPLGKLPGGYNDSKSVAIWTANGKVSLDVKMWREIINSFGCGSIETLVDYDTPKDVGQKKLVKAVDRTKTFQEQLFQQDEKVNGERIVSLGGGFSKYHRRKCAVDVGLAENIAGYTVEFREFTEGKETDDKEMKELLEETFSPLPPTKLRCISGPFNPKTVLFLVQQGIDLFDSSFPVKLAEEGHAFCLSDDFPTSSKYEVVDFNNEKFADDFTALFDGCACYTCTKYTKGYLQHLLNTRELLASILLVIHNMTEYDKMFKLIRSSLENSEGL